MSDNEGFEKMKRNCWEILNCGREPNGTNAIKLGVCPASNYISADGLNGGKNGGRICWSIAGSFCGGEKQGTFAQNKFSCMGCEVFRTVQSEEPLTEYKMMKPGQKYKK